MATAIPNSQAHEQLAQLADEQAALRRAAMLVAEGATPHRVFDGVRGEVARMFNAPLSVLMRYDANGNATLLATAGGYLGPIGRSWPDTPVIDVAVTADGGALRVEVRDNGRGGADPAQGSGLLGLRDRVEAIGGTMRLTSPPGAGTSLRVELPLVDQARSPLTHALASPPRFRPAAIRSNALQ